MNATRCSLFIMVLCMLSSVAYNKSIIVLDPAGDAQHHGRTLHQSYERAEAYKCAQEIKKALKEDPDIKVLLSRRPGNRVQQLQTASLANRLKASLVIRIHLCKGDDPVPTLYAYHLAYDTIIDFARQPSQGFSFIPLHQAHFLHIQQSVQLGKLFVKNVRKHNHSTYSACPNIYGLPIKPLVGITAPAVALEITLPHNDQEWQVFVAPIVQSIRTTLKSF